MNLLFVAVFVASVCLANGQASCRTPSGVAGECIDVYSCQTLLDLIRNPDRTQQEIIDLLKKSKCGNTENERKVCCPKTEPPPKLESGPGTPCYTPDGDIGKCVNLTSCPHLAYMMKLNDNASVKQFRCQGSEKYSVCCGSNSDYCEANVSVFPPNPQSGCCGVDALFANKILGGNETKVDQYPWLALIEYLVGSETKWLCGGALISSKYVLTTGHCVTGEVLNHGKPRSVRLGEYDTAHEGPDCAVVEAGGMDCTEGVKRILIEKTIPHPQYDDADRRKGHDIALIRLKKLAPFTAFIRPICLPTLDLTQPQNIPRDFILFAAGWGTFSTTSSPSNIKRHVDLPYVDLDTCQLAYSFPRPTVTLSKGQICAGGEHGKNSCKGDNGGPLMYKAGHTFEVIGIDSFGPCGFEGIPGVYTKVYEYLDWIRDTIVP